MSELMAYLILGSLLIFGVISSWVTFDDYWGGRIGLRPIVVSITAVICYASLSGLYFTSVVLGYSDTSAAADAAFCALFALALGVDVSLATAIFWRTVQARRIPGNDVAVRR